MREKSLGFLENIFRSVNLFGRNRAETVIHMKAKNSKKKIDGLTDSFFKKITCFGTLTL